MWLQKELINQNYMELATARANNRKVSATFVPGNLNELLMCFDFARSLPETNALQNGMRKKSGKIIMDAERDGQIRRRLHLREGRPRHDDGRRDRPHRRAAAQARHPAAVVHRLLHVHEVVRADPPQVRLRDGDAARALPGRRPDRAEHARVRGQAAEGDGDPDARAHLGRQVRHRPAAPVHARVGQGRGRPGGACCSRRRTGRRRSTATSARCTTSARSSPRFAARPRRPSTTACCAARSSSACARARARSRPRARWARRSTAWSSKARPTGPASASSGRCSTTRARWWCRRPTPRSAACTTSASATTRSTRSSRSPTTAWAATPT